MTSGPRNGSPIRTRTCGLGGRLVGDRRAADGALATALADGPERDGRAVRGCNWRPREAASAPVALGIVDGLVHHDEDAADPLQPLMIWWALEAQPSPDARGRGMAFQTGDVEATLVRDVVLERLMKRYSHRGGAENYASAAFLLAKVRMMRRGRTARGAAVGLRGRDNAVPARTLVEGAPGLFRSLGDSGLVLRVRSGEKGALAEAQKAVLDPKLPTGVRSRARAPPRRERGRKSAIDPLLKNPFARPGICAEARRPADPRPIRGRVGREGIIGRYGSTLPSEHGVRSTAERVLAGPSLGPLMMDEVEKAVIKDRDWDRTSCN